MLGLAGHHASRRAGLDAHDADVVGDDVVQLARDAHPLLEHGPPRVLLALPLQLGGLRGELALRSRSERTAAPSTNGSARKTTLYASRKPWLSGSPSRAPP